MYSNHSQEMKGRYTARTVICLLGKEVQIVGGSVIQEKTARLKALNASVVIAATTTCVNSATTENRRLCLDNLC